MVTGRGWKGHGHGNKNADSAVRFFCVIFFVIYCLAFLQQSVVNFSPIDCVAFFLRNFFFTGEKNEKKQELVFNLLKHKLRKKIEIFNFSYKLTETKKKDAIQTTQQF